MLTIAVVAAAATVIGHGGAQRLAESQRRSDLRIALRALAESLAAQLAPWRALPPEECQKRLEQWTAATRVTACWADRFGAILAQTEAPGAVDSVQRRPEFLAARTSGQGEQIRPGRGSDAALGYFFALRLADERSHPSAADDEPPAAGGDVMILGVPNYRAAFPARGAGWLLAAAVLAVAAAGGAATFGLGRGAAAAARYFQSAARQLASGSRAAWEREPAGLDPAWNGLADDFDELRAQLLRREETQDEDQLRVQAVLASMVEGVLAIDAQDRITIANDSAIAMLSLPGRSVLGRYVGQFVRIPQFEQTLNEVRGQHRSVQAELETVGADRRTLTVRCTPLEPSDEADIAVVLHDVTELRRLENVRRDFVANVSHELKTPLAAIKAYAETLRLGALDDQENNRRFLAQIESQAQVLDQQIHDLLQLGRVESGKALFEITEVDLTSACRDGIARFQLEADRRDVRLVLIEPPAPVVAIADREALAVILNNLVSNAIRYSKPEGEVRLSTELLDAWAVIEVADNGIGIAPEHQRRIFERFYRVDKARSRDVGGTGLGLAIVKHTVQALGGRIELASRIGRGSSFRILLHAAQIPQRPVEK